MNNIGFLHKHFKYLKSTIFPLIYRSIKSFHQYHYLFNTRLSILSNYFNIPRYKIEYLWFLELYKIHAINFHFLKNVVKRRNFATKGGKWRKITISLSLKKVMK